jgi:hypothetical protein
MGSEVVTPQRAPSRGATVPERSLLCLLLLCAAIAYFHGLGRRSLWADEAWVANSVLEPTVGEMLRMGGDLQSTPFLFLMGVRTLAALFGASEAILRCLPACAALVAPVLLYLLLRLLLENKALAIPGATLLAFSPPSLRYAQELKQYSSELLVVVALLLIAETVTRWPSRRTVMALFAIAVCGVWFAHAAILVLPAVVLRLAVGSVDQADRSRQLRLALSLGAAATLSFSVEYALILRHVAHHDYYQRFWHASLASDAEPAVVFVVRRLGELCTFLMGYRADIGWILAALFSLGLVWATLRRRLDLIAYAALPILTTALLALLRLYPFGGNRTNLFLFPCVVLGAAAGIRYTPTGPRCRRVCEGILLLAAAAFALHRTSAWLRTPYLREELRLPVQTYLRHRLSGDYTYVYSGARQAFRYYARPASDSRTIYGIQSRSSTESYAREIDDLLDRTTGRTRWWVIFSHFDPLDQTAIKQALRQRCRRLERHLDYGAEVFLFECRAEGYPTAG